MNNNVKLEANNDNIASDSGCDNEMQDCFNDVEQEIKQENELIINDDDSKWCYPFGLDDEEREYQKKYEHQDEDFVKAEATYEAYSIQEINEDSEDVECDDGDYVYNSEEDDDMDNNYKVTCNKVAYINSDNDDDPEETCDVYNPNVKEIDKCLQQKHVALECHLCQQLFSRCCRWTKHVQQKHAKFIITLETNYEFWSDTMSVCKQCKKRMKYKSNQLLHFLLNHTTTPAKYLICKICRYKDYKVSALQEHLQKDHSQIIAINQKCPLCPETFKQQAMLQFHFVDRHFNEFQEKFVYDCHLCEQTSFDGDQYHEYLEHLISEHCLNKVEVLMFKKFSEITCTEIYKCGKCLKLFVNKGLHNFLEHYLTHNVSFLWSCKYCRKKFIYQDFKSLHLCTKMLRYCHELNKPIQLKDTQTVSLPSCSKIAERLPTKLLKEDVDVRSWQQFEISILHICPFCNKKFIKFHPWQLHMRERHQIHTLNGLQMSHIPNEPDKMQCSQCYIFIKKSTIELHTHRFQHLPFKPYKCFLCSRYLPNFLTALQHLQNRCQDLNKKLESSLVDVEQDIGYKKLKISKDLENYIEISCALCKGQQFSKVEYLMEHYHIKHNNFKEYFIMSDQGDTTKCKVCLNTVRRFDRHTGVAHFLQHLDEKPYRCKKCQRSHSLYRRCKLHITRYHPTVSQLESTMNRLDISNEYQEFITFACPECNLSLTSHKQWEKHINLYHNLFDKSNIAFVDTSDGKQKCKDCKAVLNTSTPQQQCHKLSHMPYKAFICLLCHHRFNTLGTLQRHLKVKHFTKGTFKCPIPMCSTDALTTAHERAEHIKHTHPQHKWPKRMCVLCIHIFKELKKHMESHNINRPKYYCDICNAGIKYFKDYKLHMDRKHNRQVEDVQVDAKTSNGDATTSKDNFNVNKRKFISPSGSTKIKKVI